MKSGNGTAVSRPWIRWWFLWCVPKVSCRTHHRNHHLIHGRETAVPLPLFMTERKGQHLQPRHCGHSLDAVNQQCGAGVAEHERKNSFLGGQPKMPGAAHKE